MVQRGRRGKNKLIIFPGNFVPNLGGLETHVDEFSKYLSKNKNYEITIFSPNTVKAKEKETRHNGVKVIRYPAKEVVKNFPVPNIFSPKFYKLFFALYKKDSDIVMTRTRFFTNTFLGVIFSKFRINRKKLIHVEHGSEYVKVSSRFTTTVAYIYDKTIGRLPFWLGDKLISVSKTSKQFVNREFTKRKVEVITRGVDFEIYEKKKREDVSKKFKGKIIIGTVCRLYEWKKIDNVINAYKSLPKKVQDKCVYLVIGDGEDMEKLQEKAGKYLNNGIYFYGKQKFSEAIKFFNTFDVFVHSSSPGGALSNSLLQAMYTNNAIIASPHEGAREVVNSKNSINLKDNKVKSIRDGLIKLVNNKNLRDKLSKNAKEDVKRDFNWNDRIKTYDKVFNEVLK